MTESKKFKTIKKKFGINVNDIFSYYDEMDFYEFIDKCKELISENISDFISPGNYKDEKIIISNWDEDGDSLIYFNLICKRLETDEELKARIKRSKAAKKAAKTRKMKKEKEEKELYEKLKAKFGD